MADDRTARAEAMLDKIFTPAWREHGGGVSWPSAAGQDLARLCVEHCYADAWSREGSLDLKTRSLLTLTCLVSLGATDELKLHVRGAINNGLSNDEIKEVLLQVAVYAGIPAGLAAFKAAHEVLRQEGRL